MDTLTHAVIGALVLKAPPPQFYANWRCNERVRLATIAAASVFPDLDYAAFLIDPYRFITEWHRGISHSLLLAPLWACLLGLTFSSLLGRFAQVWELIRLCALGLLLHILFDLITVYGTRIFAPWSDYRIAFELTYDADIWIASIAAISLLLSLYRRVLARYGIVLLGLYLGLALITQITAIRISESWYHDSLRKIHAIAHPLSPFHRILIVDAGSGYWTALLDISGLSSLLLKADPSDNSGLGRFKPKQSLHWQYQPKPGTTIAHWRFVNEVWRHQKMELFRHFAVLPVLYRIDRDQFTVCLWFTDLRYVLPEITPPFRYGLCRKGPNSNWHRVRLKRFTQSEREWLD